METYLERDYIRVVNGIMDTMLSTDDGKRLCEDMGLVRDPQGFFTLEDYFESPVLTCYLQGFFTLEDYFEAPVFFSLYQSVRFLRENYSEERMERLIKDIEDNEVYGVFCAFQDIVFGKCYIF